MITAKQREEVRAEITACCRQMMLSRRIVELCEQEATPKQEEFLHRVLTEEVAAREKSRRQRLMQRAGFPVYKTFEDYDFRGIKFPAALTREELTSCSFVAEKKNLVLFGPVGTGKTHLAIALGVKACEQGLNTKFASVTEMVLRLAEARRAGTLERLVRELQKLDLLILDEWGYVPVDKEGSQLLFRVIADSYESKKPDFDEYFALNVQRIRAN